MTIFTASIELDDDETAHLLALAERHGVPVDALLAAALKAGLDQPDTALVLLGITPDRVSPLDDPARHPEPMDDGIPY